MSHGDPDRTSALEVLILPAFSADEYDADVPYTNDPPDELAAWQEQYDLTGRIEVPGLSHPIEVSEDGIGLTPTGMGKSNAATTVAAICASPTVDVSDAYVLSTGVAGVSPERGTLGSVFVADAIVDWDLKHRWAERDASPNRARPIELQRFQKDDPAFSLSDELVEDAVEAASGVELRDDPSIREWRDRYPYDAARGSPSVAVGTSLCGDEFWHGETFARQAEWLVTQYGFGPYCTTQMEDYATATALDRFGLLENYLSVRSAVNFDRPAPGQSVEDSLDEEGGGFAFDTAQTNMVRVAAAIIDELVLD